MTFEDFEKRLGDISAADLRKLAMAEMGVELKSSKRKDLVKEAYEAYSATPDQDPWSTPEPTPKKPEPEPPSAPAGPLQYEVRSKSGRALRRHGFVATPKWTIVGELSDEQVQDIERFPHLDIRIFG